MRLVVALSLTSILFACGDDDAEAGADPFADCDTVVKPSADDQTAAQEALIAAEARSTVCFAEGTFTFTDELSLTTDGVTLRGAGIDRTIFDFANQTSGGNGLNVTDVSGFKVQDLTVRDPPGDGIRVTGSSRVVFRKVKVFWTSGSQTENGAYALYPVSSTDVIVEECETSGASDAGIYVGQSTKAIVRNNYVHGNVAGIEIENTQDAEVYGNRVEGNTGGILVFNLPDLPVKDGRRTLVRNNTVVANNEPNFAPEGNIVAVVPKGTGMLILAADEIEIAGNDIRDNDSTGIGIIGWNTVMALGSRPAPTDTEYDRYAETLFIHGNSWGGNGTDPDELLAQLGAAADILWDAERDLTKENADGRLNLCIQETGIRFRHILDNVTDLTPHDCEHDITVNVQ